LPSACVDAVADEMEDDEGPKYELYEAGSEKPREDGSKMYTGSGKALYPTGDTYEGTFVEGYRRGKGVYVHSKNGDRYEGHYEENKKHGFGKMTYSSTTGEEEEETDEPKAFRGGTYLGCYTAGLRGAQTVQSDGSSDGTFTYANGDIYVGQWCQGKKHGQGTYSYAKDGTKLVGEWEKGKITNGQWIFPNGSYYTGKFRYSKPWGRGAWVFKNGNQLTGEYVQKEQPTDEDPPAEDEEVERPDPKVWCYFKYGKDVAVHGGTMFPPKL